MNGGPSHVDTFDPKPLLDQVRTASRCRSNLPTERKTGAAFPSPFKFQKYGQSGIEVSELFAAHGRVHRRHLRHPLDARRRAQPRAVADADELRRGPADPARASGSWVTLRPGHREPEPARLHRHVPRRLPDRRSRRTGSPAFLPGVYQGTYIDTQHTDIEKLIEHIRNRSRRPDGPARASSTCWRELNQRAPGTPPARGRARGAHPVVRAGLPDADRRPPTPSTSARSRSTIRDDVRPRRAGPAAPDRPPAARARASASSRSGTAPGQPWDSHDDLETEPPPARPSSATRPIARAAHRPEAARHARRHAGHLGRRVRPHADRRAAHARLERRAR